MAVNLDRAADAAAADATVGAALARYFADNGFDPTYSERWVKLRAGPIAMCFPSTRARVAAARLHDVHHLLTEYETDWRGEAEIAAWELGGGCGRYWPAWMLNIGAFGIGLVIAPRRVFRAFVRGRHSTTLYRARQPQIGDLSLTKLRDLLRIRSDAPESSGDRVAFGSVVLLTAASAVLFPITTLLFIASLYLPPPSERV